MSAHLDTAPDDLGDLGDAFLVGACAAAAWCCRVADVTVRLRPQDERWIGEVVGPDTARMSVRGASTRRAAAHALSNETRDGALSPTTRLALAVARSVHVPETSAHRGVEEALR